MGADVLVHTSTSQAVRFPYHCGSGETHAFLTIREGVRLFEVRTGRYVWTRTSPGCSVAADLVESGKTARILMVPPHYSEDLYITIREVDLTSGESRDVFNLPLPHDTPINLWWGRDLRADFFVLHAFINSFGGNVFTLVDWRRRKQIILSYNTEPTIDLKPRLLRDHILVVYPEASRPYQEILVATAFTALEKRWTPLDVIVITTVFTRANLDRANLGSGPLPHVPGELIPTSAVAKLHLDTIPICGHTPFEVCVYESPAHHDTYKIMLFLPAHGIRSTPRADNGRLFTYTFTSNPSPHAQSTFQLRYIVDSLVCGNPTPPALSYAGYGIQRSGTVGFITDYRGDREDVGARGITVVKASPNWAKMYYSPLNGEVLGVFADGLVIVSYFQ
ncbi:hypothetical protein C8J57DRAFT_1624740 [Mycena rebaudengoi]|nr:hypothetical protein C8J57DRAFT_1624740 [Mycena rebaudengoi]